MALASAFVWEWMTDNLLWRPFSPASSQAIEAAFQAHHPSLDLCILDSSSAPSHSITFQSLSPCQKNSSSGNSRPVRRNVDPQSGTVDWQWWEGESQQWHPYDLSINFQIESAWGQCNSTSNAYFQASTPAGVTIRIQHRKYNVEFEANAIQTNLFSHYSRKVRRRPASPGSGASASAVAAGPNASPSAPQASHSADVVSVPDPSISAGTFSLSYNASDLQPYVENSDDNDCPICVMNLREKNAVMLVKCRHVFCKECIMRWFETRPTCPVCTMAYGVITGIQPNGTMSVRIIPVASSGFGSGLEGFPDVDIIQIEYIFPSGIQSPEHPSPGRRYTGTRRVAYLPSTKEGEDVLNLLKTAWDRRLLFSVGTSITTGQRDVVTWSGVHHKTNTWGGPSNFGYPDPTYFARVRAELAEKGVR